MISSPQLQIQEIAESVGFEDVSHFIKLFREHNQITPYQFKKSHNCID
jgi:AraC-like DNA-binding protein